jgi:HlyD family secretion protein
LSSSFWLRPARPSSGSRITPKAPTVPTFQVKRGEFLDVLQFRGQLKAMKSVTITAPSNAGDLQILKIVPDGTQVKKGDVVVEFDPSKNAAGPGAGPVLC